MMTQDKQSDFGFALGIYLKPLLKWWWLILLAMVVAVASSYYALSQRPNYYQVQSSIILGQSLSNPNLDLAGVTAASQLAQTYVEAAKRQPVRRATMENLGLNWLPDYWVRPVPNTQLIEIVVMDTVPERALATNLELVNQLIILSPSGLSESDLERQASVGEILARYEDEIDETVAEGEGLAASLMEVYSAREIAQIEDEMAGIQSKLSRLEGTYAYYLTLNNQEAKNAIRVFEEPVLPTTPISNNLSVYLLAAGGIGFILGAAGAYLLEYLDDTLKSADETSRALGLTVLAGVGEMTPDDKMDRVLVANDKPRSPSAEVFRSLRTSIQFSNLDEELRSLVITSSVPSEGKSTIAANLAVVMAQSGQRTLLVDADLRRPSLHKIFKTTNNYGMTKLLVTSYQRQDDLLDDEKFDELLADSLLKVTENNLWLLTSGPLPPNPAEILGSAKMKWLISSLKERFDVVIFDTPPCLPVTDAVVMSARTDGTLVIGREGVTRLQYLKKAVVNLQEVNANIVGIVMNRVSIKELDSYYGSYYGHYGVTKEGGKRRSRTKRKKQLIQNQEG